MNDLIEKIKKTASINKLIYTSRIFNIFNKGDEYEFNVLLNDCLDISDEIYGQLRELIKSRQPWKKTNMKF